MALLSVTLLWACRDDGRGNQIDAGAAGEGTEVRIVQFTGAVDDPASLRVAEEPTYRIGSDENGRVFEDVVAGALWPDGRAVVVDGGSTQELVLISSSGAVEGVLGGAGRGPGEFQGVSSVALLGTDTIVAQDVVLGRLSLFGPSGFLRSIPVGDARHLRLLGTNEAESAALLGMPLSGVPGQRYPTAFLSVPLVKVGLREASVDTVAVADWDQSIDTGFGGRNPFASGGFATVSLGEFVVGRGDAPEVKWLSSDGDLRQIVRWTAESVPVTDDMLADWDERLERSYQERGLAPSRIVSVMNTLRQFPRLAEEPVPFFGLHGNLPPWGGLIGDHMGNVWVAAYTDRLSGVPGRYYVVSADGLWLGSVVMPTDFRVLAIGQEHILGVEANALGVESVTLYDIER